MLVLKIRSVFLWTFEEWISLCLHHLILQVYLKATSYSFMARFCDSSKPRCWFPTYFAISKSVRFRHLTRSIVFSTKNDVLVICVWPKWVQINNNIIKHYQTLSNKSVRWHFSDVLTWKYNFANFEFFSKSFENWF